MDNNYIEGFQSLLEKQSQHSRKTKVPVSQENLIVAKDYQLNLSGKVQVFSL
jgi:post-segregation antitoxin (ccd killing protein)